MLPKKNRMLKIVSNSTLETRVTHTMYLAMKSCSGKQFA